MKILKVIRKYYSHSNNIICNENNTNNFNNKHTELISQFFKLINSINKLLLYTLII